MAFSVTVLSHRWGHYKDYETDKLDMHFNLNDIDTVIIKA